MQTIYIDISNKNVIPTIYAKQGDVGRKFLAVLTDDSVPYSLPAGYAFSVWYDGDSGEGNYTHIGEKSAFSVDGNKVAVEMVAQMLSVPGEGKLCLVLNYGENQTATWNIEYVVESVPGAESERAEEYYTAFSQAVSELPYPDESLSVPGKAADAAATGAALAGKAPAGYGYGGQAVSLNGSLPIASEAELNTELAKVYDATTPGETKMVTWIQYPLTSAWRWFGILSKSSENNGSLIAHSAYGGGTNIVKTKNSGSWLPAEWDNPPMAVGVEYRTTERWNGKPIYKKLIEYTNSEALSGVMTLNVPHGIASLDMIVTANCTTNGYLLPYLTAGSSLCITAWNGTNITLNSNSSWGAGRKWYIELCYTKSA